MTVTVATVRARKARPKLADISLDRDVYVELCEEWGWDPLPAKREIWDSGFIQFGWLALESAPLVVESARAQSALPQIASA